MHFSLSSLNLQCTEQERKARVPSEDNFDIKIFGFRVGLDAGVAVVWHLDLVLLTLIVLVIM